MPPFSPRLPLFYSFKKGAVSLINFLPTESNYPGYTFVPNSLLYTLKGAHVWRAGSRALCTDYAKGRFSSRQLENITNCSLYVSRVCSVPPHGVMCLTKLESRACSIPTLDDFWPRDSRWFGNPKILLFCKQLHIWCLLDKDKFNYQTPFPSPLEIEINHGTVLRTKEPWNPSVSTKNSQENSDIYIHHPWS